MEEVWRFIAGFNNKYEVSTFGNVRNSRTRNLVRQEETEKGYLRVPLSKNKKRKWCKVHRLVAKTFIENPENKPQVNHKDFNKKNNRVWNLEWVTDEENKQYSLENKIGSGCAAELQNEQLLDALKRELRRNEKKAVAIRQAIAVLSNEL